MEKYVKISELEKIQRFYIDKYANAVDLYLSSNDEYEHERYRVELFSAQEVLNSIRFLSYELDPKKNMIYSVAHKKFRDYLDSL